MRFCLLLVLVLLLRRRMMMMMRRRRYSHTRRFVSVSIAYGRVVMSGHMSVVVIVSLDERRATGKMVVRLSRRRLLVRNRRELSMGETYFAKETV